MKLLLSIVVNSCLASSAPAAEVANQQDVQMHSPAAIEPVPPPLNLVNTFDPAHQTNQNEMKLDEWYLESR